MTVPVHEVSEPVMVGKVSVWSVETVCEDSETVTTLVSVDLMVVVVVGSMEDWELVPCDVWLIVVELS